MGYIIFYSDRFGDVEELKRKKFLVASWGDVVQVKKNKFPNDKKSSSSCMTDHNGPLEDVFEECKVEIKK